jgi:hypothetical protein
MTEPIGVEQDLTGLASRVAERAKSLQRQRDFITSLLAALEREPKNVSALKRLLSTPTRNEVQSQFPEADHLFTRLDEWTAATWRTFSLTAAATFRALGTDAGYTVTGQPPRLTVGRGIEVVFHMSQNKSIIDGVAIQTVDPHDVLAKVTSEHERLWNSPFQPTPFLGDLYEAYRSEITNSGGSSEGVAILAIYERLRLGLSPSAKKAFTRDVFAAHISRALEAGARAPGGKALVLTPVADPADALWIYLADRGERAYRGLVTFREASE